MHKRLYALPYVYLLIAAIGACSDSPSLSPSSPAASLTAIATSTPSTGDRDSLSQKCVALLNGKTFKGWVVNGFWPYRNGGDVWYMFSTDGKHWIANNGAQGCHVTARWRDYRNAGGVFNLIYDGEILEIRSKSDPAYFLRFTPQANGTLVRTGAERVIFGTSFGIPIDGKNLFDTGTIVFRPE